MDNEPGRVWNKEMHGLIQEMIHFRNVAKSGMNPKTLQYIMGHADISVTLNTYTHVNFDDAKEEVYRIANS